MSDITRALRTIAEEGRCEVQHEPLLQEAAGAIEHLRAALVEANNTIDDLVDAPEPAVSGQTCEECGLPIEECNKRASTRWRHRGDQTKEIEQLRAALADAERERDTAKRDFAVAWDDLARWKDMAGERGLCDPEEMAFQLDGDGRQIEALKAALADAEREKQSTRDTCVALNKHNDELEAALDAAREALGKLIAAIEFEDKDGRFHRDGFVEPDAVDEARSFLERTKAGGDGE